MNEGASHLHKCDVLIIGGGLAGCWAAIRAADFVDNVILVDKAKVARSGASTFAAGVMLAPMPEDDLTIWTQELVERGEYFNDQDWVWVMLNDQIERIREMDSWGMPFEKDEKGNIVRIVGRAHVNTRILMFHGQKLMENMREQVLAKGVTLIERMMITDLLTSDGQHPTQGSVAGAVGFSTRTGDFHIIQAGAVVVATGFVSSKARFFSGNITGDGIAAAFRAGAEVTGLEFSVAHAGLLFDRKYFAQGLNMFQNAGLILLNVKGERFMERYAPELKERARFPDILLACAKEGFEGRAPIYADMRHVSAETVARLRRVLPTAMKVLDKAGVDFTRQTVVFDLPSTVLSSAPAGVANNIYCESNISGLYAAGQAGGYPAHGTYAVGGLNLAMCCVSGYRSGEYAAKYAKVYGSQHVNNEQVQQMKSLAFAPLRSSGNITPDTVNDLIVDIVSPAANSFFKHEKRLKKILSDIDGIKALLSKLTAPDYHELVKANGFKNYLLDVELVYRAALERKESRGFHLREDFPEIDDRNWLKRIILYRQGGNRVGTRFVPIPIYRYPIKPKTWDKRPHPIPSPRIEG